MLFCSSFSLHIWTSFIDQNKHFNLFDLKLLVKLPVNYFILLIVLFEAICVNHVLGWRIVCEIFALLESLKNGLLCVPVFIILPALLNNFWIKHENMWSEIEQTKVERILEKKLWYLFKLVVDCSLIWSGHSVNFKHKSHLIKIVWYWLSYNTE